MLHWYTSKESLIADAVSTANYRKNLESHIESQPQLAGFCTICNQLTTFRTDVGVHFGDHVNLREGLVCHRCGLGNRNRLLLTSLSQLCGATPDIRLALLEENSTFAAIAKQRFAAVVTSEYLDHRFTSGTYHAFHNRSIRHESITELSYQDAELDALVHNDVLEHVFDFKKALSESARVLKKGGLTLFTTPVFVYQAEHLLRGSMDENGDITHYLPPEYHGDTLRPEGVYTFHYFGPGLIDDLLEAGFSEAAIGIDYDAFTGFTSCNHPSENEGNMMPIVIYGKK